MAMFTSQEKKDLKQLLASAVNRDEVLSLDGLHGYLFGLAIIPEPVMPSEWLSGIFGEEMLEVNDNQEGERLLGTLFAVYNRMIQQNENGILSFPFDIGTIKTKDIQRMREWTHGFFLATSLRPEIWGMDKYDEDFEEPELEVDEDYEDDENYEDDDEAEIAACYSIVMGVAFPERLSELFDDDEGNIIPLDKKDPELEAKLFALLPDAVATLQKYANSARDNMRALRADNYVEPPKPRQVVKIGRNDPCPCGSGKKYKKCCGQ